VREYSQPVTVVAERECFIMEKQMSEAASQWEERIKEQRLSGVSQKEWCRQNDLSIHTMQYWIKRLSMQVGGSKSEGQFVKVVPAKGKTVKRAEPESKSKAAPVIRYRDISIRFPEGGDTSGAYELLSELMEQ
jgi:hypothetical protein